MTTMSFPFVFFFSSPSSSASAAAAAAALPPELRTRLQSAFAPERQMATHSLACGPDADAARCCCCSSAADAPMLRPTAFSSDPESRNQLTSFLIKSRQAKSVRFKVQTMEATRSKGCVWSSFLMTASAMNFSFRAETVKVEWCESQIRGDS